VNRRIRPHPVQAGDRVEVTCGDHAGRAGQVVGIHPHDEGDRCAVVVLDAPVKELRLRHFTEGLLHILD
jgi:ribosomal protein L24